MPEWGGHPITLLHLATHTSGLPRVPGNLKPKDARNPYENYAVDDLYAFLSNYTLTRDPGSQVEYSNLGGGLLGHVLANRAGTNYESPDYESLIRARITQPLGMLDTGIALSTGMQQRMTTGHNALLEPVANWDFGALAGAGALRSSANDMLTFLEAFLGYRESPLAAAMKSMLEVRRSVPNTKFEVALGWHMLENRAWHDGGTGGFCSFAGFDRHARTGVVVLSNAFALPGIADIGVHLLNPNAPLADLDPGVPVDPQLLDNYTGRYRLAPNRVIEIGRDGGRLFAQVTAEVEGQPVAGPKLGVSARNENSFVVKMTGSQITFEIGTDGRATGLMMHRAGREPTPAPRLS
jgi:CubicO group peptidase (beta-lactamase class C family)